MKKTAALLGCIALAITVGFLAISCRNSSSSKRDPEPLFIIVNHQSTAKLKYVIGEEFDKRGIVVTVVYNDYSTELIPAADWDFSGFDSDTMGVQEITIVYARKTAKFLIEVVGLSGLEITREPDNMKCAVGERPDLTGLEVTALYSDDTVGIVPFADLNVNYAAFNNTTVGNQTLTITYGGKTVQLTIVVIEVLEIEVTAFPDKTAYNIGDALDLAGLEVTATYNDGSQEIIPIAADHVSGFSSAAVGQIELTITYSGKTAVFSVTILGVPAGSSIQTKLEWLDQNVINGGTYVLEVTANEDLADHVLFDGAKSDITIILTGSGIITISGKGSIFEIGEGVTLILESGITLRGTTANDSPLVLVNAGGKLIMNEGSAITGNTNTGNGGGVFVAGDFTMTGGVISGNSALAGSGVYVDDGGVFAMTGGSFVNNVTDGPGERIIALDKIEVTHIPTQTFHNIGDDLKTEGLVVIAYYIDGSDQDVTDAVLITGFDNTEAGVQILTVIYEGKTATFEVDVDVEEYTVTFNPNGGTWWDNDPGNKTQDTAENYHFTARRYEDPAIANYDFGGWYANYGTGTEKQWDFTQTVIEDMTLTAKWVDLTEADFGSASANISNTFTVTTAAQWNTTRTTIANGGNNRNYIINVAAGFTNLAGITTNTFGSATGIKVAVRGDGANRTIAINSNGQALTVGENQTVILRDITLSGRGNGSGGGTNNNASLVRVNNGTLEMKGSSGIINNNYVPATNQLSWGGGVYVNGGTLIMRNSARVSGNIARYPGLQNNQYYGGGVYLTSGATFQMFGGTISGNQARTYNGTAGRAYGGGVYVGANCTFEMNGGTISTNEARNNTAPTNATGFGGGVCNAGTFHIVDGVITGNVAHGGGSQVFGDAQYGVYRDNAWINKGVIGTTNSLIEVVNGIKMQ